MYGQKPLASPVECYSKGTDPPSPLAQNPAPMPLFSICLRDSPAVYSFRETISDYYSPPFSPSTSDRLSTFQVD